MEPAKISRTLLKRLPAYLQFLKELPETEQMVSATVIANALGLGDVQVRKDLAKISGEGRCRTGRSRDQLIRDIEECMENSAATATVIVGAGNLGQALLDYSGFEDSDIHVLACFDSNPSKKQTATGKPIYSMSRLESFCRCYDVRIGIIAVPAENAQAVCDGLIACGIQAIWNFAPVQLKVPEHILLHSEDLSISVQPLCAQLKSRNVAAYM